VAGSPRQAAAWQSVACSSKLFRGRRRAPDRPNHVQRSKNVAPCPQYQVLRVSICAIRARALRETRPPAEHRLRAEIGETRLASGGATSPTGADRTATAAGRDDSTPTVSVEAHRSPACRSRYADSTHASYASAATVHVQAFTAASFSRILARETVYACQRSRRGATARRNAAIVCRRLTRIARYPCHTPGEEGSGGAAHRRRF